MTLHSLPRWRSITGLTGYASALPTPFRMGHVDIDAFAALCAWQIGVGISALVVCGTTGEAPALSAAEQRELIGQAVAVARGRVPVIAGAGSNVTGHAIDLARGAEAAGADALLVVVPYYNRPSQEGLYRHFRAVHDAVGIPVLLYDVPSRTGCALADDTVVRLAELPRIVGLKDATGELARPARLRARLGTGFRLLSGDDASALGFFARGGDGCISVVSNVAPRLCTDLYAAWATGAFAEAEALSLTIAGLSHALFLESNPVPVKHALSLMGMMAPAVRLPLCEAGEATRRAVSSCLRDLGIGGPGMRGATVRQLAPVR